MSRSTYIRTRGAVVACFLAAGPDASLTLAQLVSRTSASPNAVQIALYRLQRAGLIERSRPSPDDVLRAVRWSAVWPIAPLVDRRTAQARRAEGRPKRPPPPWARRGDRQELAA